MFTQPLCPSAELCVTLMCLNQEDHAIIRNCVHRYSLRVNTLTGCKKINYIFYCLIDVIKRYFGRSDFQVSTKIIQNRALEMSIEKGVFQQHPQDQVQEKRKRIVIELTHLLAKGLLSHCLLSQDNREVLTVESIQRINKIGLNYVLEMFRLLPTNDLEILVDKRMWTARRPI